MFNNEGDFKNIVDRLNIDHKANPAHREKLRRQILLEFDKSSKQSMPRIITFKTIGRTIMKSKITKLAAAAMIVISVFIGIYQFGGSIENAAFAAVVEKLHNAHTMTYSIVTQTNIESMPTVRVDMAFKEPGYMRITTIDGYITVIDWAQNKGISILPQRKQFIDFEASNYQHDPAQDPFVVIENLRALPSRADEVLGEKEIDGRLLQGFRVTEEYVVNTIWLDPDTGELARVEMEFPDAPGMSVIMTDFQFNVQLDDLLFSITPPEDYTRLEVQADVSKVTEQDLIEYLRSWSTWAKDGTFPPTFNLVSLPKVAMEMEKQGKFGQGETPAQQRKADAMLMYRGIMFAAQLPAESNWRYAGENVIYGDADTPIFWYRPEGSTTYRVIYGDLSVKDVAPEDLPKKN
ncbi:MAG: outer membrane lipoprotein carrier protein LolA [Phycisphaerae bacterium]